MPYFLPGSIAVAVLIVLLHAQARAPFTGTVRDEGGKALANAEVTCVFVPDFGAPGELDRVTAKTDDGGRFRLQLLVGYSYTVWAIGPADERGVRSVVWPRPDGAGGKSLDLIEDERRAPAKLQVTGTTPWLADGPLSLRVFVAGACPLADIVIPGDGVANLPPLPAAKISVALLDGKGVTLEVVTCDLEVATALAFAEPTEVAFMAKDAEGKPLGGVQVRQHHLGSGQSFDRLTDRVVFRAGAERVIGVTGADGTGVGRVVGEPGLLVGRLPGHADTLSGWRRMTRLPVGGAATVTRVHDGEAAPDKGPVEFTMRPTELRSLRVLGLAERERADVWLRGSLSYRLKTGMGRLQYLLPQAAPADGAVAADGAASGSEVSASVRLVSDSAVPRCLAVLPSSTGRLADVDLAKLRRFALRVVDADGHPVPCTHVGIAVAPHSFQVPWLTRFVTDGDGRAELLADDAFDWFVYATTASASAAHVIARTDPAGPQTLKLEALATMRLRVVADDGKPVRGARLHLTGGSSGGRSKETVGKGLDAVASSISAALLALLRTNANGELVVPFLEREGVGHRFKVIADTRTSDDLRLQSAADVREVVLK